MRRIAFALLLLAAIPNAWSCSCRLGSVRQMFKEHVSIFEGTVTEIIFYKERDRWGDQYIRVTFSIEKQWKGKPGQNQLFTVYNTDSCFGYWFKEGERYLIYAFQEGDHLNAWWCGGILSENESKDEIDDEVRELDKLKRKH